MKREGWVLLKIPRGSGLSTCQAEGCPHAQEKPASPPTVGFRVSIDGLVQSPEVKFPMNAPGRGDNRGEESATSTVPIWAPVRPMQCNARFLGVMIFTGSNPATNNKTR